MLDTVEALLRRKQANTSEKQMCIESREEHVRLTKMLKEHRSRLEATRKELEQLYNHHYHTIIKSLPREASQGSSTTFAIGRTRQGTSGPRGC